MSNKWYKKGSELLREIEETCLPKELCSLWYIGQMGMILKWKGTVLCMDPVLGAMPGEDGEDRRNYPIPFLPEELRPSAAFGGEGSFFRYSKRTAFRPVPGSGDYSGRRNPGESGGYCS